MMKERLTLEGWRVGLESRGHRVIEPAWETATGFTLWPDPNTIITVSIEMDGTLRQQYRQRFFLCDPEPEQIFRVLGCSETLRTAWLELVSRQPPGYWQDFQAGPGAWLLCRLARFRQVVAWCDRGLPWTGLDDATHRGWGMEVPACAAPFFVPSAGPEASRPLLLPVESWKRLVDLYTPLLLRWLRQSSVNGSDADDLLQEVFAALVHKLPSFEHNQRRGAFRCWLHTLLINHVRGYWKARQTTPETANSAEILQVLNRLQDPASDLNQLWEREHDVFLAQRVLQLLEKDFTASTWQAFRRVVLDGAKPAEVAAELDMSVNAVHLAKWRVLRRARREIAGLID